MLRSTFDRYAYRIFRLYALRYNKLRATSLYGEPSRAAVPVVICLWNRVERIPQIIEQLDNQEFQQRFDLYFWNNNTKKRSNIESLIQSNLPHNNLSSVSIYNSPLNIGGIGRFYMLRILRSKFGVKYGIMLDDDQDITPQFISDLMSKSRPRVYASNWAYKILGPYWDRSALEDGQSADYCGTGGSIVDCSVFELDELFTELPEEYLFIEDLWLSWFVQKRGWKLIKASTPIKSVGDETDQYHNLIEAKNSFYEQLKILG